MRTGRWEKMIWNTFIQRKRKPAGKAGDEIDLMIAKIERFAPGGYRSEREVYYYNYRILRPYLGPLRSLLEALSRKNTPGEDLGAAATTLFPLLKAFYDPRDRLSLEEAVRDEGLKRKMRELFLIFYDRKDVGAADVDAWLALYLREAGSRP